MSLLSRKWLNKTRVSLNLSPNPNLYVRALEHSGAAVPESIMAWLGTRGSPAVALQDTLGAPGRRDMPPNTSSTTTPLWCLLSNAPDPPYCSLSAVQYLSTPITRLVQMQGSNFNLCVIKSYVLFFMGKLDLESCKAQNNQTIHISLFPQAMIM